MQIKKIIIAFATFLTLYFFQITFTNQSVFATGYCPNYDPSKGDAQCYCYPVTVTASNNTSSCNNGKTQSVKVTWDGANCVFCIYTLYWTDNGSSRSIDYNNGCTNYSNSSTTITGSDITGRVGVGPLSSSSNGSQITYDTPNACPAETPSSP